MFKKTGDQNSLSLYKNYRNKVVSKVRKAKAQYECYIDKKICKNEHLFTSWWKVCKKSLGMSVKSSVGPINSNGTLFTDDSDKADLLNNFYVSQIVLNEPLLLPTINSINNKHIPALIT